MVKAGRLTAQGDGVESSPFFSQKLRGELQYRIVILLIC